MKSRHGFTLMELLVVLLIIGILSTVALRTIDATRDRSLFDQTTKEMNQLVQAMVGNPDMTYDGRRVDFGFYGDMERLPGSLRDLVNNPGDASWHGPYVRRTLAGDTVGYLYDGWGREYVYNPNLGTIESHGNQKYTMTVRVADSLTHLYSNTICGTITDAENNAPDSALARNISILLYYNNETEHPYPKLKVPAPGGYYEFSISDTSSDTVPIGTHMMMVVCKGETLTRWVTVAPRSRTVVDFRFAQSFWNRLRLFGTPKFNVDSTGFLIYVVNNGSVDVTVNWLECVSMSPTLYFKQFMIDGQPGFTFPRGPGDPGDGPGDTVRFAPVTIEANMARQVDLSFQEFYDTEMGGVGHEAKVNGLVFRFRFDDGSEIEVKIPPVSPE